MANQIKLKNGSGSDPSASDLVVGEVALRTDNGTLFTKKDDGNIAEIGAAAGVSDGDKGDITVSNSGSTFTIDNQAVGAVKIADGAVQTAKLASGAVTNDKVSSSAAIAGTKISPDFGSQAITTLGGITGGGLTSTSNITINNDSPSVTFNDTNSENDFRLTNSHGTFVLFDNDAGATRMSCTSAGQFTFATNVDFSSGIDVTGNITATGTVDGVDIAARDTLFGGLTSSSGVLSNGVTATTQSAGDNSTKVATTAYADTAVSNLVDSAPGTLNTLNELAAALGDDANFSTTVTNSIATKMPIAGGTFSGDVAFSGGAAAVTINAGSDIRLASGNWTGDAVAKIQHHNNYLYIGGGTSGIIFRENDTNRWQIDGNGHFLPSTDSTYDFGTSSNRIRNGYFDTLYGSGANLTNLPSQTDNNFTNADHSKLDGIESGATADQTASEILTLIKTVDGEGSGLDADTLIGLNAATTGNSARIVRTNSAGYIFANYFNTTANDVTSGVTKVMVETGNDNYIRHGSAGAIRTFINVENGATADQSASEILNLLKTVDGSGSGLDADTLDGISSASFLRSDADDTSSGVLSLSKDTTDVVNFSASSSNNSRGISFNGRTALSASTNAWLRLNNNSEFSNGVYTPLKIRADGGFHVSSITVIDSNGSISGSRISGAVSSATNADTVDNLHASSFLRSDTGDTFSGDLTSSGSARILLKKTDNNVSDHILIYNGNTLTGSIGSEDNSWLRLNQEVGTNIYTPRYIRADNGFFVDGTSKGINGSGNFIGGTISGASDYSTLIRSNTDDNVTGHTEWQDNYQVRLGASADMRLYHNGSHSYIDNHTNVLHMRGNTIKLQSISGENMLIGNANSSVELYRDNDRVFYTETRGVRFGDNTKIFENSSHNTAILQHADIHHAIVFRGATNNNGSTITNENTTTFREYGKFVFRTGAINAPVRLTIAANGHIGAPSGSNIYPSSDVRLKKNVVNLDKGLDTIKSLRPVSFNWIDNYIEEEKDPLYGFIAQEVEAVDPNLTGLFAEEIKIGEDQENPDQVISDVKRVNEKFIIPILVKAIQELTARVETLEAG